MKGLHPNQKKLLNLLKKNIDDPLTIRALQDKIGASSTSIVAHHIHQLEKKGYLKRNPNNPQDYKVLEDSPEGQLAYIPLYGLARCGSKGRILDGKPIDRIPIATQLIHFPTEDAFLVKAKGDSMSPKINDGDLVIAQKRSIAESGDITICTNEDGAMIKRLQKDGSRIILTSANPKHPPFIAGKGFRIEGLVKGILALNL